MPSWAVLPEEARWQMVTYVEALAAGKAALGGPALGGREWRRRPLKIACSAPAVYRFSL